MGTRALKIKTPFWYSNDVRTVDEPSLEIQCAVQDFDRHIWEAEKSWGVDRLPALVNADLRQRWWTGIAMLNEAIRNNDAQAVAVLVPNMIGGLQALINAAQAAGYSPSEADIWEAPLSDGRVLRLVRTFPEGSYPPDNREVIIWSLEDVARMVEKHDLINQVKEVFPGATISKVS